MRILVVEDDPIIALATAEALGDAGHDVIGPCSSLKAAMTLATNNCPDLAVVDIDLCGKNEGLEVAHRLRTELRIDTVFASGQGDLARQHKSDALGILHKPYDDKSLQEAMPVLEAVIDGATPPPPKIPAGLEVF